MAAGNKAILEGKGERHGQMPPRPAHWYLQQSVNSWVNWLP